MTLARKAHAPSDARPRLGAAILTRLLHPRPKSLDALVDRAIGRVFNPLVIDTDLCHSRQAKTWGRAANSEQDWQTP